LPQERDATGDASIGALLQQLVDDGRNVAQAELTLLRAIARYRLDEAKYGAIALAASFVLGLSSVIVLLLMLAQGLAVHIGPVGAGLLVSVISAILAFLLLSFGLRRIAVLVGSEEEKSALQRGERRA
jgi:predicted transporter